MPEISYCIFCHKDNPGKRCARCQSQYCSAECQTSDWPSHKSLCKTFAEHDASSRPSPKHKLAMFLPVDQSAPELMWVECEPASEFSYGVPDMEQLKATLQDKYLDVEKVRLNVRLGEYAPRMVEFVYRDNFYNDGSKPNKAIASLTKHWGGDKRDWRGPLVLLGISIHPHKHTSDDIIWHGLTGGGVINYDDVNLADLRLAVDYSAGYKRRTGGSPFG